MGESNVRYIIPGPNSEYNSLEECQNSHYYDGVESLCVNIGEQKETPMYWRIVRINGDGTIRLVYDGASTIKNDEKHVAFVDHTVYNNPSIDNANFFGYSYDVDGVETDSIIKNVVETWYAKHLEKKYGNYISDGIFCNDKEFYKNQTDGVSDSSYYKSYYRIVEENSPKLKCTNSTDKYTLNDDKGNGLLNKPIGLLTADEVAMAGSYVAGSINYLYTGRSATWTMTPSHYRLDDSMPFMWYTEVNGILSQWGGKAITAYIWGARPVINLKSDVRFTGTGTIDDPYVIMAD